MLFVDVNEKKERIPRLGKLLREGIHHVVKTTTNLATAAIDKG